MQQLSRFAAVTLIMNATRFLLASLALCLSVSAQTPEGPRPPKPPGEPPRRGTGGPGGPGEPGGRHGGGPGGPGGPAGGPGGGMMGMRPPMGFDTLTEDEKKKVREAMAKAWNRPEVITARDKAMEANEQMRQTLQTAIKEIDPEVDAILEKIKPPYPLDHRGLPLMPKPESPEFIKFVGIRLRAELMSIAKPGRHEETGRFHDRIMQSQRMKDALAELERAAPGSRVDFFMKVRDAYRQVAAEEFAKFKKPREDRPASPDQPQK